MIKYVILLLLFAHAVNADLENIEGDDVSIDTCNEETIFVSLGSYCAPASLVRTCGYRKAAFPFDWNIAMDGEKLIEILDDDFASFLDKQYLVPYGWATLLNTRYHLEFVHDGSWDGNNGDVYMPILQSKYKRRIERFKDLRNYQGKVIFIRAAYIHSLVDLNRYYKINENIEITEEYAQRLYEALKRFFPTLDFSLVIINNHEELNVAMEKRLKDPILMIRASHDYTQPVMQNAYEIFFENLLRL